MPEKTPSPTTVHRAAAPPGRVQHLRNPAPIEAPSDRDRIPGEFVANAFAQIRRDIRAIAKMGQDYTKVVDEYNALGEWVPETEATLTVQPQWEFNEKIESVIITGPAAGVVSLQLGDRLWPVLVIPATGILVIAPIGLILGRSDWRILTPTVAGAYSLELMGHADVRWSE